VSADTKHWFQGQPVPGVSQSSIGSADYWFNGQPVPLISEAGGGGDDADNATDFRVGGSFIVEPFTPTRVTADYDVRRRTS